jgi:hypothetical protein
MYTDSYGLAEQGIDCTKLKYPTDPDRCLDEDGCFKKAEETAKKCNAIWSAAQKVACLKCNETYVNGCPGKVKAPDCGTACASKPSKGNQS